MKRLAVLSVAYPLAPVGPDAAGGSEQILTMIDRTLARNGHTSVVIAMEGSRVEGRLLATPRIEGALDDTARAAAHAAHREAIRRALGSDSFDLIHMHAFDFHHYLPPAGPPLLVTLHLPPGWYPAHVFRPERPGTWLHCVSRSQERSCPSSPALLPYIENGVACEQFRCRVRTRKYALALGRICPEKGFHLALDAAALAGTPLIVAGDLFRYREHEEYFRREMAPRLVGRSRRFIGPVGLARKRRLLAGARCLLVPSLAPETSSLVAMEALASGTPVIAFPSGALPEIVEHGRTGFLVHDTQEMAAAICQANAIDPDDCRQAARERFSAGRMAEQYLSCYQRLAGGTAQTMEACGNRAS
jgi:glycosyltransferase involved in cell wall biosynthesis